VWVIRVEKVGDRYSVSASPPHSTTAWSSSEPLAATVVLERLATLGCHSTDITDAMYEADPDWAIPHDAEVLRRRRQHPDDRGT
jgi:hypothetical protein